MINGKDLRPRDISIMGDQLTQLTVADLKPLPAPFDKPEMEPGMRMGNLNGQKNTMLIWMVSLLSIHLKDQKQKKKKMNWYRNSCAALKKCCP